MKINHFLFLYSISHFKLEPFKILITIFSIAIGISSYFSIKLANDNALLSMKNSLNIFAEESDLSILSETNEVDENIYQLLNQFEFIESVSPMSSRFVTTFDSNKEKRVQIIGIDLFSYKTISKETNSIGTDLFHLPYTCLTSSPLVLDRFKSISLLIGSEIIILKSHSIVTDKKFNSIFGGNFIICDISTFQEIFKTYGKIDRLDIRLKTNLRIEASVQTINNALPSGTSVIRSNNLPNRELSMTEAFRFNLNFLASISLLLSGLLVYNTSSYFSIKRRREYSILHALGMKKKDILILGLTETLLLGLIGSLLGIIIGYGITHQIIGSIFDTVTTLYLPIEVTTIHVTKTLLATTLLIGIATSFCGAILPQIEASYQSLNSNFHEQSGESKYLKRIPMMLTIGILFVSSALLLTKVSYQQEAIFKIIPLIFILGIILTIPALFKISIYLNKTLINIIGDIQLRLAIDHINQTMRRNVTSVTSMVLAIGFCIGITTMIISFRTGVELWIKQALQADLFISPSKSLISSDYLAIPDEVIEKLDSSPLIKDLDYVYPRRINFRGKTIDLAGVSFKIIEKTHRLDFIETTLTPENSQEIYISEVISNKFQIKSGQSIELPTDRGLEKFHVTAIFRDYSSDRGLAMIKAEKFRSSFKNSNPSGLSIYLNKSSTRGEIESLLLHTFPEYNFFIRDNTMLKNEVLAVFDKTFRITYALVGISLFISFLAIFNSILMLLLERKRDFLIFRAIGARKSFVSKMVAYESLIIGTNSSIIGLLVGIALSYFLVHIVTPQFFGWSFVIQFPISLISILLISLIILSIVSGLIPAYFILSNEKTSEVRHVD